MKQFDVIDLFAVYWIDKSDCCMPAEQLGSAWQLTEAHLQQAVLLRLIEASAICYADGVQDPDAIVERYTRLKGTGVKWIDGWKEIAAMLDYYGLCQGVKSAVRRSVQYVNNCSKKDGSYED